MHDTSVDTMEKPKILVVEDEAIVALDIEQQLRRMGYLPVGHCSRGETAIDMARALRPDLVLMDIQLGGSMDGITAAQAIRATRAIPIVFLTAFEADDMLARAKLTEPFGYILKPFSTRELHTVIEMALYRSAIEAQLRKSELQFRTIFEAEPECVQVLDRRGVLTQINAAGLKIFEAESLEQLQTCTLRDLVVPAHAPAVAALIERVLDGQSGVLEFEIVGLGGTRRWLDAHAAPIRDEAGQVTMVLSVARDITERRMSFQQRRVSDHVLSAVSQGVVISGPDQRVLQVNDAFLKITGRARAEMVGANCKILQGPDSDRATIRRISECLATGNEFLGELLNYRKDGSTFWNELTISPVLDERGAITQYVGIMRDVSERKEAQAAQQRHLEQLQSLSRRVLEAQETERRRVAHELHDELGQYLTAIKINLQTAAVSKPGVAEARNADNVRIVEDAIQQVRRLASALRPAVLDDLGLVPALKWMAEVNAARGQIAIGCHIQIADVRLLAEIETAYFRVAQEALTNILRHARCTQVDIRLFVRVDSLVMTIHDDGRGFDVEASLQRARSGGSLGVIGMYERASLIGGSLKLESSPSAGSTLTLECPLQLRLGTT